jgi:PAS domain-containing protein
MNYLKFFEKLPALCIIADKEATILDVNHMWVDALGFEKSDLIGHKFLELIHPDDIEKTKKEMELMEKFPAIKFVNRYKCKKISMINAPIMQTEGYIKLEWYASTWDNGYVSAIAIPIP